MMDDYIRREDARRMVVQLDKYAWKSPVSDERRVTVDVDLVKFGLDRIPAADVAEVVHARWKRVRSNWYCTGCNKGYRITKGAPMASSFSYCPNCGTKMDGGDGSVAD